MNELLSVPEFRAALASVVVLILVQAAVRSKEWLEKNKTALRIAIYVALLLGAILTDWLPDNMISWSTVWIVWMESIVGTTVGHATLIKLLEAAVPSTRRTPVEPG